VIYDGFGGRPSLKEVRKLLRHQNSYSIRPLIILKNFAGNGLPTPNTCFSREAIKAPLTLSQQ